MNIGTPSTSAKTTADKSDAFLLVYSYSNLSIPSSRPPSRDIVDVPEILNPCLPSGMEIQDDA